ncbi:MAG TPA: FAD-dependent oxidoreductase [Acidobacteriaceae bacterium]|nr:FAD-dependent oxidoreductase [Acidobacteriaceae bacterium]
MKNLTRRQLIRLLGSVGPMLATPRVFGSPVSGALASGSAASSPGRDSVDLLVYGATASGVIAAYSAARQGLRVILLEPGNSLGGMLTGGLSATDVARFTIIGGYPRAFYTKAAAHYGIHDLNQAQNWRSEPRVGEEIFQQMLSEAGVLCYFGERLREHDGVELQGKRIVSLITSSGRRWPAQVFADCSYEGDLMAQAKISYTWGREPVSQYGEDLAGVRADTPKHQFTWPLSAYDSQHQLLPEIDPGPMGAPGSGDKKVQAYNFRVILTTDRSNQLPFTRPEGYNRAGFALLERYLKEFSQHKGRPPLLRDITNPVMIPNHKADFNNNGPVSTDFIGKSWKYPEASYAEKARIWDDHLLYTKSFFYFIAQDPAVPLSLRNDLQLWGLPKDEFAGTDHWPNQLYVREGRRMIGDYVMRQSDLQIERTKPDSVGMGSYNSDSHNVQRIAMPDGTAHNEGDVQVPVQPYEIPYRCILPKRSEAENLLVPVCLSASHVAYSSLRMEPQYMIIGQAAGTAASLAIARRCSVQDVPVPALQQRLQKHQAILHLSEEFQPSPGKPAER